MARAPKLRTLRITFEDGGAVVLHARDLERRPALASLVRAALGDLGLAERPKDPYVTRAVEAMRRDPASRWTLARLAREAGLSRAPLARRFRRALGTSPLRWLADLRLRLAAERLLTSEDTLAAIAAEVGYVSEFAFAKAFKRRHGVPPGVFRRRALGVPSRAPAPVRAAA